MKRKNQGGEIMLALVLLGSLLMTGTAVSMKVHDPEDDEIEWAPPYQESDTVMSEEDHIYAQMKGPEIPNTRTKNDKESQEKKLKRQHL